jgi:hypothetical protein
VCSFAQPNDAEWASITRGSLAGVLPRKPGIGQAQDLSKEAGDSARGNKPFTTPMEPHMTKSKRRTGGERSNRRKAKLRAKGRRRRARA